MPITRREMLKLGGLGAATGFLPSLAAAQAPRRGGTLTIRQWERSAVRVRVAHRPRGAARRVRRCRPR